MNNFDYMRKCLHDQAGVDLEYHNHPYKHLSFLDLVRVNCQDDFAARMDHRLCMGYIRYNQAKVSHVGTFIARLKKKLAAYEQSGNTELLVDIANYCRLEYRAHPHKFQPIDRE